MKNETDYYHVNSALGCKLVASSGISTESARRVADPDGHARFFMGLAHAWAKSRGHVETLDDPEFVLAMAAVPWHVHEGNDVPATELNLWAVPRKKTYEFLESNIGTTFDCRNYHGFFDCWLADDFGDVAGLNPATSAFLGMDERRVYPGPCVFAGFDGQGGMASLRDPPTIATIAAIWTRAARAMAEHSGDGLLTVAGGETMDMDLSESVDEENGMFNVTIGAKTPAGSPLNGIVDALCAEFYKRKRGGE